RQVEGVRPREEFSDVAPEREINRMGVVGTIHLRVLRVWHARPRLGRDDQPTAVQRAMHFDIGKNHPALPQTVTDSGISASCSGRTKRCWPLSMVVSGSQTRITFPARSNSWTFIPPSTGSS